MNEFMIQPGTRVTITNDISLHGAVVFSKGEQVVVEQVTPNTERPEQKYVVSLAKSGTRVWLRDSDISLTFLLSDSDEQVRIQACTAIGDQGTLLKISDAVDSLINVATEDSSRDVQNAARTALGRIYEPRAWAYADFGEPTDNPLVCDIQDDVSEPVLAASHFQRHVELGVVAHVIALAGGVAMLGIMLLVGGIFHLAHLIGGNIVLIIGAFVLGFAATEAIVTGLKIRSQRSHEELVLPKEFVLAVTATKVLAFKIAIGGPPHPQIKDQVAGTATKVRAFKIGAGGGPPHQIKKQVAEWNRAELPVTAEYVHGKGVVVTLHPAGSQVETQLEPIFGWGSEDGFKRAVVLLGGSGANPA